MMFIKKETIAHFSFIILFFAGASAHLYGQKSVTLEDIWTLGSLNARSVPGFNFMKDGKHYTRNEGGNIEQYDLTSGQKVATIFDASVFKGKDGFVTMAIEYVPYTMSKVKVKSDPFLLEGDNNTIKSVYRDVINVKAGVEIRRDNLYYRGGLSYFPDPYIKELDKVNRDQFNISIGMGYRTETFYFDGSLVNTRTKGVYSPYSLNNNTAPQADVKYSTYLLTFTAGLLY